MKAAFLPLALLCVATVVAKEKNPPIAVEEKVVVLDPVKITGSPVISFSIDIVVYAEPKTKKVNRIFIERVLPDSDAERAGLQQGDEIVKLDGVAAKEFDAAVSIETPLGQKLLKRTPGESLKIEVVTRRTQQFTLRAQREMPDSYLR